MSEQESARPKFTLPTERIAFERQLEVLRAYVASSGQAKKSVSNTELGAIVKLNASTASLANPFLKDARLIEAADGGHVPTAYAIEYARAFEWEPETAGEKLAPAFRETWFDQAIRPTLYIRPMSEDEALQRLADAAAVGPKHRPQLKVLLDYLQTAGLIKREGGQVMNGSRVSSEQKPLERAQTPHVPAKPATSPPASDGGGGVNLEIHIEASLEEIKDWTPDRIAAFFSGIGTILAARGGSGQPKSD